MDPQYSQLMIQQLMGNNTAAPGMNGQNASTPYGANFMTGNMMSPNGMSPNGQMQPQQTGSQMTYPGMLGQGASSVLQQPMATY